MGTTGGHLDDMGLLEVKIVSLDYYRKSAGGAIVGTAQPRLPVIRVYGVTKHTGQKIAVHVHNVLPYFFVPLPEVQRSMAFLGAVPWEEGRCLEEHFGLVFGRRWMGRSSCTIRWRAAMAAMAATVGSLGVPGWLVCRWSRRCRFTGIIGTRRYG